MIQTTPEIANGPFPTVPNVRCRSRERPPSRTDQPSESTKAVSKEVADMAKSRFGGGGDGLYCGSGSAITNGANWSTLVFRTWRSVSPLPTRRWRPSRRWWRRSSSTPGDPESVESPPCGKPQAHIRQSVGPPGGGAPIQESQHHEEDRHYPRRSILGRLSAGHVGRNCWLIRRLPLRLRRHGVGYRWSL